MDCASLLTEGPVYTTKPSNGQASKDLRKTLSLIIRSPIKVIVPPWSWKAAALTATFRAVTFFLTNLKAGPHVALRAMWVEAVYATFAGGLAGAISQQLRRTKPLLATILVVFVGLPAIFVIGQAAIHAVAHTPRVAGGLVAAFLLTSLSSGFSWYAMRHGAMLGEWTTRRSVTIYRRFPRSRRPSSSLYLGPSRVLTRGRVV